MDKLQTIKIIGITEDEKVTLEDLEPLYDILCDYGINDVKIIIEDE